MSTAIRWTDAQVEAYRKKHGRSPATAPQTSAPAAAPRERSQLEQRFEQQLVTAGIEFVPEYYLIPGRDFRIDFAIKPIERRIGVEIQGASHRIKGKFKADLEKRALALVAGWRVLELGREEIRSEKGIEWLKQLLEDR